MSYPDLPEHLPISRAIRQAYERERKMFGGFTARDYSDAAVTFCAEGNRDLAWRALLRAAQLEALT